VVDGIVDGVQPASATTIAPRTPTAALTVFTSLDGLNFRVRIGPYDINAMTAIGLVTHAVAIPDSPVVTPAGRQWKGDGLL
jgi:hypothetical protein